MSFLINPYRYAASSVPFELDDLFANSEIGDTWRFNSSNMSLSGATILSATGLANALLMPAGGGSPQLNTISGNQCATFDGNDDHLEHDFGSAISQPITIILSTDVIGSNTNAILAGSDNLTRCQIQQDNSNRLLGYAGSNLLSGRTAPMEKAVVAMEFNGASSKIYVNGVLTATGNMGSDTTDFLTLAAWADATSEWAGSMYGAMLINRLLTTGSGGELDRAMRLLGSWGGNTWPTGWWQTMFNAGGLTTANSGGWNGFTWRIRMPAASLTDVSGSSVRIGLQAASNEPLTITKAYIGLESGGNFQYATAPTQLTWDGGSASTTITTNHLKMTDAASLALDGTATVVVSLYMNGGTSSDGFRYTSTMNGLTTQFKGAVDEAATTGALSGYTAQNGANPIAYLVVA